MTATKGITEEMFTRAWLTFGSPSQVAEHFKMNLRTVHRRAAKIGLKTFNDTRGSNQKKHYYSHVEPRKHPARHQLRVVDGYVIVWSDAHFWPGVRTTAFQGVLHLVKQLKPKVIVNNGDAFDGAAISRFPRIGWDSKPMVTDELKVCKQRLDEIEEVAGDAKLIWPLGNHDARFETFLAAHAPQYEGVKGFTLRDHFEKWTPCWSVWINDGEAVIKHRWKSGIHAVHNNAVGAGKTMVTGHLHSLKVSPISDYNPRPRWGVDCGTLAEPGGPQFVDYVEDSPVSWRSGFIVLSFRDGELLWPEIVFARNDGCIEFRGEVIDVSGL